MIKFFRHIRQNMINENRVSKYLLYAIGEIVLVVIGILIALQVNTWKEQRNAQHKTQRFLTSLHADLGVDLKEIEFVIEEQNERLRSINEMIALSKDPDIKKIVGSDTLKFVRSGRNFTFFPVVGAYTAARNTGLLENIKDESIKHDILNLYEHLYTRTSYIGKINDERYERVDWEGRQYIDFTKPELSYDRKALLDKNLINQIGYLNRFIKIYISRAEQTKEAIISVQNEIEQVIGPK